MKENYSPQTSDERWASHAEAKPSMTVAWEYG
jgi:hypothetical protein